MLAQPYKLQLGREVNLVKDAVICSLSYFVYHIKKKKWNILTQINLTQFSFVCTFSQQISGANSKLVMCGLTSIGHAIADTEDRGLLSICGFDLGALSVIRNLAQDLI